MDSEIEIQELEDIEAPKTKNANNLTQNVDHDGLPSFLPDSHPQLGEDGNPIVPPDTGISTQRSDEEVGEDGLPKDQKDEPKRMRRLATIMNLLNSLLGAGILGVPGSMHHIGIIPSIIMIAIIALLSNIATVMTIKLQKRCDASGFDDLAFKTYGKLGSVALSIMIVLFCISCCVAYLIIGTDSIVKFCDLGGFKIEGTGPRALTVLIFWAVLPGLLTFPKNVINIIQYFSFVNFACVAFFVIAMVVEAIIMLPENGVYKDLVLADFGIGVFQAISIYGLAFALPVVVLPIIEPYNKDIHKRSIVSGWTNFLCFLLVVIPGILGYLIYGKEAGSNVLNAFPTDDILISIVRAAFIIVVSCSYPSISQSLIASWSQLIFKINTPRELPFAKRILCVCCSNAIPLVLAMFLPNASAALSIGGAFGGCLADFFFPPMMWMKISKKPIYHWQNILCIIFSIFGVVACVISTYLAVVDAIKAFS